jgi:aminoglycoside 6'-N-acetyltransferase
MDTTQGLPTLCSARLVVRPPLEGELDAVAAVMAVDPETNVWWSTDPATIRGWFADPDFIVLIVEENGLTAGIIAFEERNDSDYRSAAVDISLLSGCVGRGLGPEALRLLVGWLIDERGHHRVTIDPAVQNGRAIRAYEKVGFRPIGVARDYERGPDGSWHDNLLMDLLAGEFAGTDRSAGAG